MAGVISNLVKENEAVAHPLDSIEKAFYSLGLRTPLLRGVGGFALAVAVQSGLKELSPGIVSYAYNEYGQRRPWAYLTPEGDDGSTYFPWWMAPAATAILFGVFI